MLNVDRFRETLARRFGFQFEEFKLGMVADVLERRSEANGVPPDRYLAALETAGESGNALKEWRELARQLTVGESYFFRNEEQFRALREVALPARMHERSILRRLSIASIGCSSGEEPYSIAMVVRDLIPEGSDWSVAIAGLDLNPDAIEKARAARYSEWSLRGTPAEMRARWFTARGRELILDERIRRMVTFEQRNVVADDPSFWSTASFDIVFCRNMLMYLTPRAAHLVVDRIGRALLPGGFFFLGHAETLRGLSREFHLRHTHDTFYYQKRSGIETTEAIPHPAPAWESQGLAELFQSAGSWVDTISRSSERIRSLTSAATSAADDRRRRAPRVWDLAPAVELLREERYDDALALLDELPTESAHNADVLILRAVLLTHRGELAAAESTCREVLVIDELNAGAHYLMALCREGAGDLRGAEDHDLTAGYLDPSFAAPRLHLGLLARRSGDLAAARRHLEQAVVLLEREDASRLLLFGGGFSRDALLDLCRSELRASEGSS